MAACSPAANRPWTSSAVSRHSSGRTWACRPGELLLFAFVEQLLRAEAGVGPTVGQQVLHGGFVEVGPLALAVGAVGAAHVGALVGPQAQPTEVVDDAGVVRARGAFEVGVLDAEHHGAAVVPGVQIVVEGGAGTAHVEGARRTGSETYADVGHRRVSLAAPPAPPPARRCPRAAR